MRNQNKSGTVAKPSLFIDSRFPTEIPPNVATNEPLKNSIRLFNISPSDVSFLDHGSSVIIEFADEVSIRIDQEIWGNIKQQDK